MDYINTGTKRKKGFVFVKQLSLKLIEIIEQINLKKGQILTQYKNICISQFELHVNASLSVIAQNGTMV